MGYETLNWIELFFPNNEEVIFETECMICKREMKIATWQSEICYDCIVEKVKEIESTR